MYLRKEKTEIRRNSIKNLDMKRLGTGYRRVAIETRALVDYINTHTDNPRPVASYVAGMDGAKKDFVCKIARACGYDVVVRMGFWYECGEKICAYGV